MIQGTSGFWIQGPAVRSNSVSHGLNVFTSSKTILASVAVGDSISLSGVVSEFRSSGSPDNLFATELQSPTNIVVLSSNQVVTPVLLGTDRSPPTRKLSALDPGNDGWLAVPNNQSRIDTVNATLVPDQFGMDFWASLEGQLVTVPSPVALDFANSFGEFWVHGDWPVTGKNSRGGLTISFGKTADLKTHSRLTHALYSPGVGRHSGRKPRGHHCRLPFGWHEEPGGISWQDVLRHNWNCRLPVGYFL